MAQALSVYRAPHFGEERGARMPLGSPRSQGPASTVQLPSSAGQPALSSADPEIRGLCAGWMPNALAQLSQIDEEAAEEGYPSISEVAKRSVKRLLFALGDSPIAPAVYPSMDGEVAIYFKSPVAAVALLILVDNQGGAGCYASIHGENRRRHYEDASVLPDEFLKKQLRVLGGASILPDAFLREQLRALGRMSRWQQNLA